MKFTFFRGKGLGKEEKGMVDCLQMRRREDNLGVRNRSFLALKSNFIHSLASKRLKSSSGITTGGKTITITVSAPSTLTSTPAVTKNPLMKAPMMMKILVPTQRDYLEERIE